MDQRIDHDALLLGVVAEALQGSDLALADPAHHVAVRPGQAGLVRPRTKHPPRPRKPREKVRPVHAGIEPGAPSLVNKEATMADVIQLQQRDQWQCTVEVIKKPDGKHVAVLVDARGSIINGDRSPAETISYIAHLLEESVAGMRATAQAVKS